MLFVKYAVRLMNKVGLMNKKVYSGFLVSLFLIFFLSITVYGDVTFKNLDVSQDDKLLFEADVDSPVFGNYSTLFMADLKDGKNKLYQLTFFPEKVLYLRDKGVLQIQNRFGVFRSDSSLKTMKEVGEFPSFTEGSQILTGKINPIESSPDGRFLLYYQETSDAFGNLVLFDVRKSKQIIISRNVEISLKKPDAIWSSNSKYIVYYKKGNLYYYSIEQLLGDRVLAEVYRRIGKGKIVNVRWGKEDSLYYLTDNLVYRIDARELFTRALYSGFLKIGTIIGKIPFSFDPNFDKFWISPDGKKIIFDKGGRNVFLYFLSNRDFLTIGNIQSLPYLFLPRNTVVKKLVWSKNDIVTLLTVGIEKGKIKSSLFRLTIRGEKGEGFSFVKTKERGVTDIFLSENGDKIALLGNDRVVLKDYKSWKNIGILEQKGPLTAVWVDNYSLIVCGSNFTKVYNLKDNTSVIAFVSQPSSKFGFDKNGKKPLMLINGVYYGFNVDKKFWERIKDSKRIRFKERSVVSGNYRVYLEGESRGNYRNMVMVRDIRGYGTKPLFPFEKIKYEPFPSKDEPVSFVNFTHGSRIRRREVALVFNAIDSTEGLATILKVLREYKMRATFFVNGEFIRRYPDAVKEIAQSGHEVGSLFYVYFNMTDSRFHLDKKFIKSGLAKTEDEYFNATGKDLSLLWHAPYYFVNSDIIAASEEMNYTYVGRDVDSLDWVTKSDANIAAGIYMSSAQLVERILKKKKPGSIIPIRVGIGEGKRDDYLFQKLDLLINGLVKRGYRVVSVSTLMDHAR